MRSLQHLQHLWVVFGLTVTSITGLEWRDLVAGSGIWDPGTDYLTRCDFNNNSQPFCDWTQTCGSSQGTWIRTKHATPTPETGPESDYPDGRGYFIYQEASNLVPFDSNRLESPVLVVSGEVCIDFWYHMHGSEDLNKLKVLILAETEETEVWRRKGNQSSTWLHGLATVHFGKERHIQVAFEAVRGLTEFGDTAVDNVAVRRGPCKPTTTTPEYHPGQASSEPSTTPVSTPAPPHPEPTTTPGWPSSGPPSSCDLSCSFDTDFCSWKQSSSDSADWARHRGPTPSQTTGPSFDHTTGDGYFIYLDGSSAEEGDVAHLLSPICSSHKPQCIHFWYHMYGVARTMALHIYVASGGAAPELIWSASGNKGNRWWKAEVSVAHRGTVQIILEARRGDDFRSDVAVDDIFVVDGYCSELTTPAVSTPSPPHPEPTTTPAHPSSESCLVFGDPHYYTFDKQTHHFMGNCTYTLSRLCNQNSSLPFFNVEATNEHRGGNTQVSYVQSVDVDVSGVRITLGKGGVVKVNGMEVTVPTSPAPGVEVQPSGFYRVVSTDFGLRVRFDGDHQVEVTVPGTYQAQVCGLCGNYNGNPTDDFQNPDGGTEPDSTSLGTSWQVSNSTSCSSGPDPACTEAEKEVAQSSSFCGLITDGEGPFRHCHSALGPAGHFAGCLYDQCALHLDPAALCRSLQAYADACRALGILVEPWRNNTFCPVSCPPNSHFEACATACPATCVNPTAPSTCSLPCVEACLCDSGFLLYDGICVPSGQCGCWHEGRHYPVGAEFWEDDSCSSKCTCPSRGGQLSCSSASCPEDYYCGVENGIRDCHAHTYGVCQAYGDPHYYTFDGATHHFMGTCTYTLAKVCTNATGQPAFNVEAKNEHRGNPSVSYVQRVLVEVYGQQIEILKNSPSRVLVNQVWATLPVAMLNGALTVSRSGRYVAVETDFQLRVSYDTDHSVEIRLPTTYFNQTCGLCGNFNGHRQDDSMMPNGQQAQTSSQLGESWQVPGAEHDEDSCGGPAASQPPPTPCPPIYETEASCGLLISDRGPFAACHSAISPMGFFESCVFDMCAWSGSPQMLCSALESYADACQGVGVNLPRWRNATFCPLPCPANSHYSPCTTACPAMCANPLAPRNCSKPCAESCECDAGFALSGTECVSVADCGCLQDGKYYKKGETFWQADCQGQCRCIGNNSLLCNAETCRVDQVCKVQNGLLGCFAPDTATCHIYGDPHYITFDGRLYHFQGGCNYTAVQVCTNSSEQFSVTTRNERPWSASWTALNSVAVSFRNLHIALRKNKEVYVNEAKVHLPVELHLGIRVEERPPYVVINTPFGLLAKFDGDQELLVQVDERYKGHLCGLCGTYSGSQLDDFLQPDRVLAHDPNQFGSSWRVPDEHWVCDPSAVTPPSCNPEQEMGFEDLCRVILATGGPFEACHWSLPPQLYFESCVYDQCATGGDTGQFCKSLEAYAAACELRGVDLGDWRKETVCGASIATSPPTASTDPTGLPGTSPPSSCDFSCSFDTDFCSWKQSSSDSADWTRHRGPTPSQTSGPSFDHTTGDGYFIYLDGSSAEEGDVAHLLSPICSSHKPKCIHFWYHMYGVARTMALHIYVASGGAAPELIWSASGNKGNRWWKAEVSVAHRGTVQIILEARRGDDFRSDVAVDDIFVVDGYCSGPTTPPVITPAKPSSEPTATPASTPARPSSESCLVSGDPHYYTFDKQTHHFMGNCTYTLSRLCNQNSSLPFFNVEATNEHRGGNTQVSYVQSVDVDVSGVRITLGKGGVVKVNGMEVTVPTSPAPGVEVQPSGFYRVVSTDFGLRVRFDGDHQVEVTVPGTYQAQVCGLCGNYNGNPTDDFQNPDGGTEPDSTSLGTSWQVSNSTSCSSGPDPACTEAEKEVAQSSSFCGLITDGEGPFRHCHSALGPAGHFAGCLYDQCALHLDPAALCRSLQAYADACRALGILVEPWRNNTFCPVSCPPNSHFEACATACPATCVNPTAPSTCSLPCVEACLCDSGFLLYDGTCVPSRQCGCWHEGRHYPVGAEFWEDDSCSSKCTCPSRGGQLSCSSASCPEGHYCGVENGIRDCHAHTYGVCQAYGDPHYYTFDGATHHFMGTCTYTLAKVCTNATGQPAFNVEAKNEHRGNPSVSYVQRVLVEVYGQQIEILKNSPSRVLVNQVWATLPVAMLNGALTVSRSGRYVALETDFQLRVSYDTDHSVEIRLPTTYFNQTCGLCGNFNGHRQDDSMMPNGQQAQTSTQLGESWQVPGAEHDEDSCGGPAASQPPPTPCPPIYETEASCGLLISDRGPFAACHSAISPTGFFESCVFDMCAWSGSPQMLCSALESYADACQGVGVNLPRWRNATFCPLACPQNTHYEPCATACPATCLQQQAPENCSQPCVEDCACDAGLVLSGQECVPLSRCGCVHDGQYYREGESFVTEDCSQSCTCQGNGTVGCVPQSCSPEEVCRVQEGLRGCYPAQTATCHVYGDPHYFTFDGRLHHFQGACNYTLVQSCNNSSTTFSITARNEHRGSPLWTALNSVSVTLKDLHIALRKGRAVYINGILATSPAVTLPGATIEFRGSYVHLTTDLGVRVQFDGDQDLLVSITESHKGRVCGLCGTYTGDLRDDFTTPTGEVVDDTNAFGNSWRVKDDHWPCNSSIALPETCPPSEQQEATKRCQILSAGDGPFAPCHAAVPPQPYLESCTQDLCATGGSSAQLCNVLRSYVAACQAAGIALHDWEAGTVCASCFLDCSFNEDFCGWQQSTEEDFDWILRAHCLLSATTSSADSCSSSGVHYLFADSHFTHVGERGTLMSPGCTAREPACFHFWYQTAMASEEDALKVYIAVEGEASPLLVWLTSESTGDRWRQAQVDLHVSGRFQIFLEGVTGRDNQTRIAVDEVSLSPGCCLGPAPHPETSPPPGPTIPPATSAPPEASTAGPGAPTDPTQQPPVEPPSSTPVKPSSHPVSGTTSSPPTTAETQPPSTESCLVSGDPHYYTFDKQTHHFMGNCTYTLSRLCNQNSSLPFFNVEATNEHRGGNTQVSYVQSVDVDVSGVRITLGKGGVVKVNGMEVTVPTLPAPGVEVQPSGFYRVVSTDFGLRVRFDGDHQVEVTVPGTYQAQVCGLCGNYNGNPTDDFQNPDGGTEPDSTSLGTSWQVSNSTSCSSGPDPACTEAEKEVAQSSSFCGLITDGEGPFRHCHSALGPAGHFAGCLYDQCALHLDPAALCRSLQAYADACWALGIPVEPWRNNTFCPVSCPPNSHFEACATACPATCVNPTAPSTCSLPCVEACLCDSGFLLYDGTCVPSRQCGCWHEGRHYPVGAEFWEDDSCSSKCTCPSRGGQLSCSSASCPEGHYCGVENGIRDCHAHTYGVCQAYGDPHYYTFDGATHHFMGTCTYTLAKVCTNATGQPAFNVEAKNEHRGNPSVSYVQRVLVEVYGQQIEILKNSPSRVLVNQVWATLPVAMLNGALTVSRSGRYVALETDFQLRVSYDTDHSVEIRLPTTYFNQTCGLCGNFNGHRQDDSMMPNGQQAQTSTQLGKSWQVPGAEHDEDSCGGPAASQPPPTPCPPIYETEASCGLLISDWGPFAACHSAISPTGFFESCVFDMCAWSGSPQMLCSALESYADACQGVGVNLPRWRNATFCPLACPQNTHYEPCATACPATCLQQQAPENCSQPCVEDCACDEGLVLSGQECVPLSRCGCVHDGQYYREGESFVTEDCSQSCTCQGNGTVGCVPQSCSPEEVCGVQEGLRGCYPALPPTESSSSSTPVMPSLLPTPSGSTSRPPATTESHPPSTSQVTHPEISPPPGSTPPPSTAASSEANTADLETTTDPPTDPDPTPSDPAEPPTSSTPTRPSLPPVSGTTSSLPTTTKSNLPSTGRATCSASGDPHYTTFDGQVHHFMGVCTYTLARVCSNTSEPAAAFDVSTTNERRDSQSLVSYVSSVHVEVHGHKISLLKNRKVNVDGRRRHLPVFLANGQVVVQSSGNYIMLETDHGLAVRFDGNHYVAVSVPPPYQGQLCGLCGNYNGDPSDDNLKPDGQPAGDSTLLGDSWLVPDNITDCSSPPPPHCKPELESEIRSDSACSAITDPTGIFSACHSLVNPEDFYENCVYDLCLTDGQQTSLCYGLQAYAESCANAGVCLDWRNATFCPVSCPAGSHFQSCGNSCPPSCVSPSMPHSCSPLPVEGCFCQEGFILSGDRCVPESSCGCVDHQDKYYQLGESWFASETCSERCTCQQNNSIVCVPWECGVLEKCGVQDGVLGCHTSSRASCHVVGDPHYYTFDRVMHTFLGSCTYTLVTVCNSSSTVTPITISGRNEDRGKRGATYLQEVYVDVYDTRITLQKNKRTLLNNQRVLTPLQSHSKGRLTVGNVGIYLVVETDFGLMVKFDGNQYLEISLPGTYFSQVCGLCGNYNGWAGDELLMPGGLQAKNVTQFGNSWKVDADSDASCLPDTREDLGPPCTPQAKPGIEEQCSVLQSSAFVPCHHLVTPGLFLQTCVYDMCKYDGMRSTLCAILQAYADACNAEGVKLQWRNSTFCPLPCPPNSNYTNCAPPCPATCDDIYAVALCEKPSGECLEGCVCNKDHVLSDDQCVPLTECGCRDQEDNYHKVGESWVTPHCTQKCRCRSGGIIKCQSFGCEAGEICQLKNNGKYGCKPTGFGKCLITGDPHYLTFDGLLHHFQGTHTYVVAQSTPDAPERLEPFSIEGKNKPQNRDGRITFLKELQITVYNHTVRLRQGKKLVLDGVQTEPPAQPHEGLRVQQRSMRIFLETDFGLTVSFDGAENSDITLPNNYKKNMEGLCGNFDGKYKNDFTTPDGTLVKDVDTFGNSWQVPVVRDTFRHRRGMISEEELDTADLNTGFTLSCSPDQLSQANSSSRCGILADPRGPFQDCYDQISSSPFLMSCLFDLCLEADQVAALCRILEQYALACQEAGVQLGAWRESTSCALKCPPNSKYSPCTAACPASCADLAAPTDCSASCLEGCECLPGYVLSGLDCVPFRECGCTFLGRYYKAGESFMTEDCGQYCVCTDSSSLSCSRAACTDSELCSVASFSWGCHRVGPCLPNPCLNDGICQENDSPSGFFCKCLEDYQGDWCEIETAQPGSPPGTSTTAPLHVYIAVIAVIAVVVLLVALTAFAMLCTARSRKQAQKTSRRPAWPPRCSGSSTQGQADLNYVANPAFEED